MRCRRHPAHLTDAHPQAWLAPLRATPERAHFYKWIVWSLQAM